MRIVLYFYANIIAMNRREFIVGVAMAFALAAEAKIELGTPFADGMVLQRGMKVPVWGKAEPGRKVTVEFAGNEVSTVACPDGCWKVKLPAMCASKESRTLAVTERESGWLWDTALDTVEIRDVLVGEVWFCSGQSNTECPIWGSNPHYRDGQGATVIQMTVKPNVRVVKMERCASATPRTGYRATWRKMTPQTLYWDGKGMPPSAMGYYYALELANALDIPIGLLDSSWGGTGIDAWTPPSGYEGLESLKDIAALPTLDEKAFVEARTNGVYKGTYGHGAWHQQPSALWNGMVAAFAPMAIRGFIWYQGCHNAGEAQRYCDKMHALYNGWAKEFANPDLKLYFAQLAPYGNGWYAMDLAQAKFEREEKNAAMAIINDVGCLTDIHPNDKRTVAKRLALHALKRDYGFDWIVDNSPTLRSWKVEGDKFVLSFNDAKEWYLYNPDWSVTNGFEVCGTNGVWTAATIENLQGAEEAGRIHGNCRGQISGADLVISAKGVDEPVKLRYLFRKPWKGNLYSEFALPLGAFEVEK